MTLPSTLSGRRRWIFVGLAANGLLQAGFAFAMAWLVRAVFDGYLRSHPAHAPALGLGWCAIGLATVALATAWLRMRETVDAERLGQDYVLEVRRLLMLHLTQLAPRAQRRRASGSTFLRFVGDLTALKQWLSLGLAKLSVAGLMIPGILLVLAAVSLPLAATVATILAAAAVTATRMGPAIESSVRASRKMRSKLAANINEKIGHMAVVQVYGRSERERNRLSGQSQSLVDAMVARARVVGTLRGLAQLTAALSSAGVLLVGVLEVRRGTMTAGEVVAAMSVVGLMVTPIRDLGRVSEFWHASRVAREKLLSTLASGPVLRSLPDARRLASGPGRIEFVDVALAPAFEHVTLVAEAGQRVVLVGDNGSGKSALLALLPRLADPDQGSVRIDGQDIATVSLGSLRRAIGLVSPEFPLLRGSLRRNLTYRMPDASEADVQAVVERCGVDRLLRDLPDGLKTMLSEDAIELSVGQRRRVMLARALLGNPRVLLLDDADSNVDAETLAIFVRVLEEFPGTILLVSQRPELAGRADARWTFGGGRVLAETQSSGRASATRAGAPRMAVPQ